MGTRDRDRLRVQLTELKKRGRSEYAHLEDPFEDDVSAFIMDFGRAVVVEFSKPGNACFIYGPDEARKRIGALTSERFQRSGLKGGQRHPGRFVHYPPGRWQDRVRQHLARVYGIRA